MPRDKNHDYRGISMYHVTIRKGRAMPAFCQLVGTPDSFVNRRSAVGEIVERHIKQLPEICPAMRLLQYVIMPDHIHLLVYVTRRIPHALGSYIGMMKVATGQELSATSDNYRTVFEEDFHDRILRKHHSLNVVFQYIRNNPRRLLLRRERRDFFSRTYNLATIEGIAFQAYGNLHLLQNPFREQVVVHRADSSEVREANRDRWLHLAANGGVVVSPFISPHEKEIRREVEALGGKQILLTNKSFGERYTPAEHNHLLCSRGELLILAPVQTMPECKPTWMKLNRVAEVICSAEFAVWQR